MPYSKEELEAFIKADQDSLRNYDARMAELRERVKEKIDEARRLKESSGISEETDAQRAFEEAVRLFEDRVGLHRDSNKGD